MVWNKPHTFCQVMAHLKPIKFVFLQRSNYISRHEIANLAMNAKAWMVSCPFEFVFLNDRKGIQQ
ncbi:hypothetical protein BWD09_04785 [Neisseria dentiae]|uniref:Uncharacterized protein n=1 Tax=Neisseria dentiae TaxID=194197 RepID=A0A1X3DCX6_9NEIS|nr:hypothetical protein [Neisseria dentiae]OSI17750.1 hypothetical protein BWD09_04785 [Neisseria dentiae]STZ50364.1 Uncharacterised protein [Neisseria dentiae]